MKSEQKPVHKAKMTHAMSWLWIASLILLAGCGGTGELIRKQSFGTRSDVYAESGETTTIPQGFADLRVAFSVKTHRSGFHVLESGTRGSAGYVLVLNIDGHATTLPGVMSEEDTLDERPRTPETGIGIRYRIEKNLRLRAGVHKVFIAVPEDEVAIEQKIQLEWGTRNELLLEPVYGTGVRPTYGIGKLLFGKRGPNFCSHLRGIRMLMNGKLQ